MVAASAPVKVLILVGHPLSDFKLAPPHRHQSPSGHLLHLLINAPPPTWMYTRFDRRMLEAHTNDAQHGCLDSAPPPLTLPAQFCFYSLERRPTQNLISVAENYRR